MCSQTLGTALGDWTADTAGLGYLGGMAMFTVLLAMVAVAYRWTRISHTALFWAAFVLTRPLGAVVGDFLDKPLSAPVTQGAPDVVMLAVELSGRALSEGLAAATASRVEDIFR